MAFIPQPVGLSFEEWSAVIVEQYADQGVPEGVPPDIEWRTWGEKIQEVDALSDIPYPGHFDRWEDWAERVVESLEAE